MLYVFAHFNIKSNSIYKAKIFELTGKSGVYMKNKKSNKRRQSLHQLAFDFLISIPVKIVKTVAEELKNIINIAPKIAGDLKHKSLIALTVSKDWAMQYRIVQVAVNLIIKIVITIQGYSSKMNVAFKTFVVNEMPITAFVLIARVLPIGDWLKYEEQDEFGHTSFSKAIWSKNFILVDRILKVISDEALHRYLFMENRLGNGPLQYSCLFYEEDTTATRKIVNAIKPEKRLWVFNRLIYNKELLIFRLVRGKNEAAHFKIVMDSLPEKDKFSFINQADSEGYSPILYQAMARENWERVKSVLDYYPKARIVDYLNIMNDKKETFFTEAASQPSDSYIAKIIELLPENQRDAYLSMHHQGLKALLYAKAHYKYCGHQVPILESFGIKIPEEYQVLSSDELREKLPEIFKKLEATASLNVSTQPVGEFPNELIVREKFKVKHGVCPLSVLKLDNKEESTLEDVKSAYRKMMLFCHPDKNNGSVESTLKSHLIIEAYEVYVKPETRKKYYSV